MNVSRTRVSQVLPVLVLLGLVILIGPATLVRAGGEPGAPAPGPSEATCSGYYYTVKLGDTWSKIARSVGVPLSTLKAANPQAVRPRDLIFATEKLCIPSAGGAQQGGYWYQVRPGDTWKSVAQKAGIPMQTLWEANPRLVNKRLWLYIGQVVWIPAVPNGVPPVMTEIVATPEMPAAPPPTAAATSEPNQPAASDVTATALPASAPATATPAPATATPVTPLPTEPPPPTLAPTLPPTPVPTDTATTLPPTPVPTATSTLPPTPVPTDTATALPTLAPSSPTSSPTSLPTAGIPEPTAAPTGATGASAGDATPTAVPSPLPATATPQPTAVLPPIPADCPKSLAAYGDAMAAYLNKAGNTANTLRNWLGLCRVVAQGAQGVAVAPITAAKSADVIAIVHDPAPDTALPQGTLFVYHKGTKGYTLAHKHEGQGRMALVQADDVNADGKFDIVYTDTSCGAHTCFGTLFVDSWDGKAYQDWITDEPTMAYPEVTIKDSATEGQASEILIHGGVIGSVGAGPQRAWTETYISPKGAPYVLFSQVYDPSTCLYHKISDANRAFDAWALDGFEPAIEAYKAAIADPTATACGTIKDEVTTLRDFARVRLIVAEVAAGRAAESVSLPGQITNKALSGAAAAFLTSYRANTSVIQACRDTNKYAEATPAAWQFLADWGYANPSFTAQDLCPLN